MEDWASVKTPTWSSSWTRWRSKAHKGRFDTMKSVWNLTFSPPICPTSEPTWCLSGPLRWHHPRNIFHHISGYPSIVQLVPVCRARLQWNTANKEEVKSWTPDATEALQSCQHHDATNISQILNVVNLFINLEKSTWGITRLQWPSSTKQAFGSWKNSMLLTSVSTFLFLSCQKSAHLLLYMSSLFLNSCWTKSGQPTHIRSLLSVPQ